MEDAGYIRIYPDISRYCMWVVLGLDPPQHLGQRRFDIACSCRLGSNLSGPCEHPIRNRWHIAGQHNYLEVRNCRDSLQRRCAIKDSFLDVFPRVQCFFFLNQLGKNPDWRWWSVVVSVVVAISKDLPAGFSPKTWLYSMLSERGCLRSRSCWAGWAGWWRFGTVRINIIMIRCWILDIQRYSSISTL